MRDATCKIQQSIIALLIVLIVDCPFDKTSRIVHQGEGKRQIPAQPSIADCSTMQEIMSTTSLRQECCNELQASATIVAEKNQDAFCIKH